MKRNLALLLSLSAILALSGCATAPKPLSKSAAATTTTTTSPEITTDPTPFVRSMEPGSVKVARGGELCPGTTTNLTNIPWKRLAGMANACATAGKWTMVEDLGNLMAKSDAVSPWGPYYLSLAADSRKDYARALWMAELAGKKAPKNGLILFQQARIYWFLEEFARAEELLKQSVEESPRLMQAHLMLAKILFRDQELSDAARHFEIVLSLGASDPESLAGLAECRLAQGDVRSAVSLLSRAIGRKPNSLQYRLRYAHIMENQEKDLESALDAYRKIKLMAGRLDGQTPADLSDRIARLESAVKKAEQVSWREPSAAKKGVKK